MISTKMLWVVRLCLLGEALTYGFGLLYIGGLIPEWGRWYSYPPFFTAQAEALLHGRFALSHTPFDLDFDLVWSNGGIQQVWGLGIPCFRAPLLALAHFCGYEVFPEHIATGFAISVTAFCVLTILVEPAIFQCRSFFDLLRPLGGAVLLLLFPPFVTLLRTRFLIYEEVLAYTYLYGILEAVLLWHFLREPSSRRWTALMIVAGFGPFVRPPLIFYGIATWLTGTLTFLTPRESGTVDCRGQQSGQAMGAFIINLWPFPRFQFGTWLLGSGLFALIISALLLTNWIRFGRPDEFGHKLNVQKGTCNGSLYATRYDYPFEKEPIPMALKEFVGALFFAKPCNIADDFYKPDMFWGQSKQIRMRELSFSTFDWTYLGLLISATALVLYWVGLSLHRRLQPEQALLMKMGIWCFLSVTPLFWFYLRMFSLISRYLLDFAPAFAILIMVVWWAASGRPGIVWRVGNALLLSIWIACEIAFATCLDQRPLSLFRQELPSRHQFKTDEMLDEPVRLGGQITEPVNNGIPYNTEGWKPEGIQPLVTIFVEDAQFLELEMACTSEIAEDCNPNQVRAKIGLEFLELESVAKKDDFYLIRFKGPRRADYQKGIQPAFIAVVPNTHLADTLTPWTLRRVRWRNEVPGKLSQEAGRVNQRHSTEKLLFHDGI